MDPLAWRPRHDDFAAAARALRLASPQGADAAHVAALAEALELHAVYEETVLWPRYAQVAPDEGPGSLRALHRDHDLLRKHLADAAHPQPLRRAWALARLEGVLEHHDQREAHHVLPALERLAVVVDIEEPVIPLAPLLPCPADTSVLVEVFDWAQAVEALAAGRPARLPSTATTGRAVAMRQRYNRALAELRGPLPQRREALLDAFDRALELAWMHGQAKAPWAVSLRGR